MNVHRKLPKLVDIHCFIVLSFCFAGEAAFVGFKVYIEFVDRVFIGRGLEAEHPKRINN